MPRFDCSAVDGFALRAQDLAKATSAVPIGLALTSNSGRAGAASEAGQALVAGQIARIMTGAALPSGADAVVMQESPILRAEGQTVQFSAPVARGAFVRWQGEEFNTGDRVLMAGQTLGPGQAARFGASHRR
jgi:molybdopterin molybdotransferase